MPLNSIHKLLFLLAAMAVCSMNSLFAETEVSGEVSGVWDREGSPYVLVDSVLVNENDSLIVTEAVDVNFNGFPIVLLGSIFIRGTEDDSVFFFGADHRRAIINDRWGLGQQGRKLEIQYLYQDNDTNSYLVDAYINEFRILNSSPASCRVDPIDVVEISDNNFDRSHYFLQNVPDSLVIGPNMYSQSHNEIGGLIDDFELQDQTGDDASSIEIWEADNVRIHDINGMVLSFGGPFETPSSNVRLYASQLSALHIYIANDWQVRNCIIDTINAIEFVDSISFISTRMEEGKIGMRNSANIEFLQCEISVNDRIWITSCEGISLRNSSFSNTSDTRMIDFSDCENIDITFSSFLNTSDSQVMDFNECENVEMNNSTLLSTTNEDIGLGMINISRGHDFNLINCSMMALAPSCRRIINLSRIEGLVQMRNCIVSCPNETISMISASRVNCDYDIEYNCISPNILQVVEDDTSHFDNNLFIEPLLAGGRPFDFHLKANSPCIDAGHPDSPPDEDDTRADMGAIFYNQNENNAPIITSRWLNFGGRGREFEYQILAEDEGRIEFRFVDIPGWLNIGDGNILSGVVPVNLDSVVFTAIAEDDEGLCDTSQIIILGVDGMPIDGILSGVLSSDGSPYTMVGDVVIPADSSLIIEEGVDISVLRPHPEEYKYSYSMAADGKLKILGTPENMVRLHADYFALPEDRRAPSDLFSGIFHASNEEASVDTVIIRYTELTGSGGIYLDNIPYVEIIGCYIHDGWGNIFILGSDDQFARVDSNTVIGFDYRFDRIPATPGIHIESGSRTTAIIRHNKIMNAYKRGILCISDSSWISNNYVNRCGLANRNFGIYVELIHYSSVHHNLLVDNGAGIYLDTVRPNNDAQQLVFSNTIVNCWTGSAICLTGSETRSEVANNIVHNAPWALHPHTGEYETNIHNNIFSNCDEDFVHSQIEGYGIDTLLNRNGTPCDIYGNIFANPEFIEFGPFPYGLRQYSPGVNGGSDSLENDPDGSISDIGYRPYNHENGVPEINAFTPEATEYYIPYFGEVVFSMDAIDDGDTLWGRYLNDGDVAGNSLTDTLYFAERKPYRVIGEVTDGNSVQSTDWVVYVGSTDVSDTVIYPQEFSIDGLYPNPFNSTTTIAYSLPEQGDVRLSVFDLNGREVSVLHEGNVTAGNHTASWHANNLPSGLYWCRLESGSQIATMKLTLIK